MEVTFWKHLPMSHIALALLPYRGGPVHQEETLYIFFFLYVELFRRGRAESNCQSITRAPPNAHT